MHGAESEPSLSTGIRVFFNRFVFGGRDEERVLEAFHMSQQSCVMVVWPRPER